MSIFHKFWRKKGKKGERCIICKKVLLEAGWMPPPIVFTEQLDDVIERLESSTVTCKHCGSLYCAGCIIKKLKKNVDKLPLCPRCNYDLSDALRINS